MLVGGHSGETVGGVVPWGKPLYSNVSVSSPDMLGHPMHPGAHVHTSTESLKAQSHPCSALGQGYRGQPTSGSVSVVTFRNPAAGLGSVGSEVPFAPEMGRLHCKCN